MKILVVDDEALLVKGIRFNLQNEGYEVITGSNGLEAVQLARDPAVGLIILDVMMPEMDGMTACAKIREFSDVPIILLTAKTDDMDKLMGFEHGADDYVTKPFDSKEVVARVKAVLRRAGGSDNEAEKIVKFDKLTINLTNYELIVDGKQIDTPPKELELIYHLASNPNRVYSRDQLLDEVWGFEYYGDSRTVDVHVKRLREKLEGVSDKWSIKTVWSVGYKFELKQN